MSGREFFRYSGCLVLVLFMVLLGGIVIYMLAREPWVQPDLSGGTVETTTQATTEATTQATTEATTQATTEATTEPTEATTEPTEVTTEPTEVTTEPTEPTTEPTEPTTEPTEPETRPPVQAEGMAAVALAQVGKPYKYGGDTPEGFDISGLVYYCARQCGIDAPRSWKKQLEFGQRVEKDELQPGDVVYFWLDEEGTEDYVGIYVGDGKFVAARNESNPVSEMDLTNSYFGPRLMYGRRYE